VKLLGSDGKPARAGLASAVAVADWDGDGDLDLLVGNIQGEVWLLPNEGKKDGLPVFGPRQSLGVSRGARGPGSDAGPCVADWDGDGVLDLLVGDDDGGVLLYQGAIEQGRHVLHRQDPLIPAAQDRIRQKPTEGSLNAKTGVFEPIVSRPQQRAKPCACDWNGDGKLDLLVGDFVSLTGPEPVLTTAEQEEKKRLEKEYTELSSEFGKAYERIGAQLGTSRDGRQDSIDQAEDNTRMSKLLSEDAEYMQISRRQGKVWERLSRLKAPYLTHGYVWVYLAK
jgi:hypothetical protein